MHTLAVLNRVRVSGREDDFIVAPVDQLARVADVRALLEHTTIERSVSFSLLSATFESEVMGTDFWGHEYRMAAVRDTLRSSTAQLSQSSAMVADLQDSIEATLRMIQTSLDLIAESDRVIARRHAVFSTTNQSR